MNELDKEKNGINICLEIQNKLKSANAVQIDGHGIHWPKFEKNVKIEINISRYLWHMWHLSNII